MRELKLARLPHARPPFRRAGSSRWTGGGLYQGGSTSTGPSERSTCQNQVIEECKPPHRRAPPPRSAHWPHFMRPLKRSHCPLERAGAERLGGEQVSDSAAMQCQGLVAFEMGPIPIPGLLPVQAFGWQSYGAAPPHHHHHHHPSHWMLVKLVCLLCPLISSDTHTIERCLFSGASCPHCFVLLQPLSVWHEQR